MQQTTQASSAAILSAIAVALGIIAILRSPRKLHTTVYIIGAAVICGLVGTGIGFALGTAAGAGALAVVAMQIGAIAASIERIQRNGKITRTKGQVSQ